MIDPRAIIDPSAQIGNNVTVGPWTLIGPDVVIGDDCWIASHVVLKGPTVMGRGNRIFQFASVGEDTPALAYAGEPTRLVIGDNNVIREGATIHRGLVQDQGETRTGSNNLLMAYVHVGHDCVVGSNIIMSNNAGLAGHVTVGDYANISGYAGIPQFRAIGAHAFVGGMSLVVKDVPAFVSVNGHPAIAVGLNLEGMRRRDISPEATAALKEAYRLIYRRGLKVEDALEQVRALADPDGSVATFADSIQSSRWGIARPRGDAD